MEQSVLLIMVNEWMAPGRDAVQKFEVQSALHSFVSRGDDLNAALRMLVEYQAALSAKSYPAAQWSFTGLAISHIDAVDEALLAQLHVSILEDLACGELGRSTGRSQEPPAK